MKNIKFLISIYILALFFCSCNKDNGVIGTNISDALWLEHKGAQMPILVEGNTASKTFILILHGGPGGTATVFNEMFLKLSEPLEQKYAVAYWDQRLSGNSKGHLSKDKITIDQMVEDLDKVIDLLKFRYGQDISLFLMGHSWGGYLGNAYLAEETNQQKVKGWIPVSGAYNIKEMLRDALPFMEEIALQQIANNSESKEIWEEIVDYVQVGVDSTNGINVDISIEINKRASMSNSLLRKDGLVTTIDRENISEIFSQFVIDNNHRTNSTNARQMAHGTDLWENMLERPLDDELTNIFTPSLLLFGKLDAVVPPSTGEKMFEKLGTPSADKYFHILERSAHTPMFSETDLFLSLVIDFVEDYK